MVTRKPAAAVLVIALGVLGCSKTQDTAPETRIFGDPPTISGVDFNVTTETATCDITTAVAGYLCLGGAGRPGYYEFSPGPTVEVNVGYTQFEFLVTATDPQSTPTQSDILLVTASFQSPSDQGAIEETSLLLLDDGGALKFPWKQGQEPRDDCTFTPECICNAAEYDLTTNDRSAGDDVFTRGFAFLAPGEGIPVNASGVVESCVARERHQAPFSAGKFIGTTLDFKVEAIDRSGNDTIWPQRPAGPVGPITWSCVGDDCAWCIVTDSDPLSHCGGKTGMIARAGVVWPPGQGWPEGQGLCQSSPPF
jgi:hypothetical protein